jgi:hypothetical protein
MRFFYRCFRIQTGDLDVMLAKALAVIPEGESKAKGIALGKIAAADDALGRRCICSSV